VIVTDLDVPWIAACGLDCGTCDIRLAPTDSQAARRLVAWFQEMGWLEEQEGIAEAVERGMYCKGCRGDRSTHWSADCWILHCCVDERGLVFCPECARFPCERLTAWAQQNAAYAQALDRLHRLAQDRGVA
jgi:hypothetical protein